MFLSLTHDDAVAELRRQGVTFPRATALYRAVFKRGNFNFSALPEFVDQADEAARCAALFGRPSGRIVDRCEAEGVIKFVTALDDGSQIESVLIPNPGRDTLCISSQVGCRRACRFCATGQMGWVRDLRADEIVGQAFAARFELGRPVNNVVFMGMGEPLDNLDAVLRAIDVLTDQRGLDISRGRITVSTAGQAEGLSRLAARQPGNLGIAISLNAADDALRSALMPINQEFPLKRLKAALKAYPLGSKGVFLIEYVLLAGVNDSLEEARRVVAFLEDLPVRVNLIAYNPGGATPFETSTPETVRRFRDELAAAGLFVRLRPARGGDVWAACGQLGGGREKAESIDLRA
jgi:23S rRNA (adenine2503-C2)-methyltransferase